MAGPVGKENPSCGFLRRMGYAERPQQNLKSGLGAGAGLDPAPQLAAEAESHAGSHDGQGAWDIALREAIVKAVQPSCIRHTIGICDVKECAANICIEYPTINRC